MSIHERHDDAGTPRQPAWRRYLRMIRRDPRADLDDELRDHVESTVEALVARGYTEPAARAEALRRFGDVGRVRAEVEHLDAHHFVRADGLAALETFVRDVRYAARGLRRSPLFTTIAALSIALGVAANSAVFSVVNALLLRPIPGTHAAGLVRVYRGHHSQLPWHDLDWFRSRVQSLDYLVGERQSAIAFRYPSAADAERIHVSYVTHGFFQALGVATSLGRTFDVADVGAPEPAQAVLGYAFWQRRFAGDSTVIGRRITLSDRPVTIVGVASPDFRSSVISWTPDILVPLGLAPTLTDQPLDQMGGGLYATARLRAASEMDGAERELRVLMAQLARTDSAAYDRMTVRLDHVRGVNAELRPIIAAGSAFMMAMVAMVLLVACANVANLLVGRATARRTEMGIRLAIGASRARLVRQLLTESFLLAAIGAVVGLIVTAWITRLIPAALPPEAGVDRAYFAPDGRVVAFTAILCLLTTFAFGIAPALHAASPNLVGLLKGTSDQRRRSRRGRLVVVQSAMCVVLLAVASLFLRSMTRMMTLDPGFRADGVVAVDVDLNLAGTGVSRDGVFDAVMRDAAAIPGVQAASFARVVPLSGSNMETPLAPEGMKVASAHDYPLTYFNVVAPRYFATLQTPILRGREFSEADRRDAPRVAVVNEAAARRWWNGDAIGKRFRWGGPDGALTEIVGVARNADYVMFGEEPKPTVYLPIAQDDRSTATLLVRTTNDLRTMRAALWEILRREAPALPPPTITRMVDEMSVTLLPVRAGAALIGLFGALALVLAAGGIYGVASYSVASRSREIGIRAALGADRARLLGMVLLESTKRVALGAAIGIAVTIGVATALRRVLYGVDPVDPTVILGVGTLILLVAVVAAFGPARRAAGADPVTAIRSE